MKKIKESKIVKSLTIKNQTQLTNYIWQIIEKRAKEQGKKKEDISLEDIYQALKKGRSKFPKIFFKTKISTIIKAKNILSLFSDAYYIAGIPANPINIGIFAVSKTVGKLLGRKVKQKGQNMAVIHAVDFIAKEAYKDKKKSA